MCINGNVSCNYWRDFKNTLNARVFQMSIFKQFFKSSHFYICYSRYSALSKKFRLNWNGWVFAENELSECDAPQKHDSCPQKYVFCFLWNRPQGPLNPFVGPGRDEYIPLYKAAASSREWDSRCTRSRWTTPHSVPSNDRTLVSWQRRRVWTTAADWRSTRGQFAATTCRRNRSTRAPSSSIVRPR